MTCDQAIRLVEKLADGEAKPSERTEAESHLESCEDCRSHYQFVRALVSASEKIDWPEPPEAYWQHLPSKVLARLEREEPARSLWQKLLSAPVLRFGAVAATLTVVVAVGFSVLENDQLQLESELAQPASAGKRQTDEKAAGVSAEPEPLADKAPSLAVESASAAPEESGRVESARRTSQRRPLPESFVVAPTPLPTQSAEEAETELAADVANTVGLAEGVSERSLGDAPAAASPSGRDNRMLRALAEAPAEPGEAMVATEEAPSDEIAPVEASVVLVRKQQAPARARTSVTDRCGEWRAYLAENGDEGRDSLEALYEVALCSLERYASEPSDDARAAAVKDVEAFLTIESDGERADEVRSRSEQLR